MQYCYVHMMFIHLMNPAEYRSSKEISNLKRNTGIYAGAELQWWMRAGANAASLRLKITWRPFGETNWCHIRGKGENGWKDMNELMILIK